MTISPSAGSRSRVAWRGKMAVQSAEEVKFQVEVQKAMADLKLQDPVVEEDVDAEHAVILMTESSKELMNTVELIADNVIAWVFAIVAT
jgi:hypothetical protein